jgi:hypothetical protein
MKRLACGLRPQWTFSVSPFSIELRDRLVWPLRSQGRLRKML